MKKILVLLLAATALCLLLTSCMSLFPSIEEKGPVMPSSNRERSTAAINLLGSDMIAAVGKEAIVVDDYVSILPPSYSSYVEFVPSYETLKTNYLNSIAGYAFRILCSFSPELSEEVVKLAHVPTEYISGDTTLADKMKADLWSTFYDELLMELKMNNSLLEEYFEPSRRYFEEIRKAYANLENVGVSFVLPSPESVNLELLAERVTDCFFSRLAWYEKFLKNTPAEAGTLYTVFWEN
ncbi:MAG: hypothetical protein KBS81_07945 [Spirochaetales bacterium]|nr:hypothetical protein [Candidatus Physcosoma equi]